ncbi:Protein BZZ1 [Yamadazyma tenuis]|uniref:Protein BZZ1 n=1 Tax=Candida tenuis (strain ATCC 10573 / BCRC 21748 / CBS 615 / JCM 9827 / NBRC 10315 / NRRL Y-1498 / VKM Y-70) TaxID=590646 RepID=G3B6Y1_CANTC|nr:FCH-domain-containing protein [Yamadazyma tenuis ATCC 10573]EGV63047.1 FCH-domain-containing protein [Yamadazyma tenuis ATCC 10573]WEJ97136.1 Protein BZZ1 [Yamadazyma tenuis]
MSLDTLSLGNELKDSYKPVEKWVTNGINWLGDIDEFYQARATIEKEYSTKLKELCKRHFEKKAKLSAQLSVGDEPQITPGSLESASLVLWNDVLTQTEAIAEERSVLARDITSKVGASLQTLKSKASMVARNIDGIHTYLDEEKKRTEEEVAKAKKHYDSLCSATEATRQKTEKSSSDKHQRKLEEKETDMNIGKNEYLIKINVANRLKDKYFYQDLPEILDYYQELNQARVQLMNKILRNAGIVERNSCDRVKDKLTAIDSTIEQNNPRLDTAMFIKHNLIDWKEPSDFYFVPSSIWHDDESLVTKEPELSALKKALNKSSMEYEKYQSSCLQVKQSLEESVAERAKENKDGLTLKFDAKFSNSLHLLSKFIKEDTQRVKNEVVIELIQNYAGDKDLSYQEQAHAKKSRFGLFKGKKSHEESTPGDVQSIHTVKSTTSQKTAGSSGIFNLRRGRGKSVSSNGTAHGAPTGRAAYKYEATGDDECSVNVGDVFTVVDADDGSGWTMIDLNGRQGLVPTSYITVDTIVATNTGDSKKQGPSVAPKRGAKRVQYVEALYDYVADGEDELSISVGDRIVSVQEDTDGSGWTEGELNGNKGLFPSSYVKKV